MHRTRVIPCSLAALGLGLGLVPARAFADITKVQCIDADTKSQDLRRAGKLSQAREQLRKCVDPACPRLVRDDCTRRLDELESAQPTVIFDVKDGNGADVIDVRVRMDGQPLVERLDGTPLQVDPGAHTFTFEVAGQPPVVDKVLVREGEVGRHERVVVGSAPSMPAAPSAQTAGPATVPAAPAVASPDAPSSGGLGTQRTIGLALGGVGVAGLAAGAVFGLLGTSAWSHAKQACGGDTTACTDTPSADSYRSTASTDATIATVGFIAGGALLATGAVLFLTGGHESHPAATWVVRPSVGPGVAAISLSGGFR